MKEIGTWLIVMALGVAIGGLIVAAYQLWETVPACT